MKFRKIDDKHCPPLLVMTADDGLITIYSEMFKYMRGKGVPYITPYINGSNIDRRIGWPSLMIMQAFGCDAQDHGHYHDHFPDLETAKIIEYLTKTNELFESRGLEAPKHFAYPYNHLSARTQETITQYRLTCFDGSHDLVDYDTAFYSLIRTTGDIRTEQHLQDAKNYVDEAVEHNKIMFTNTHAIDKGSNFADKEKLEEFIDYAIESGITFATISTAYRLMKRYREPVNRWRNDFKFKSKS